MSRSSSSNFPDFDFSRALTLGVDERLDLCMRRAREIALSTGCADLFDFPLVAPVGASEPEIDRLEKDAGIPFPHEYRSLLRKSCYVAVDPGLVIWGAPFAGESLGSPWLSEEHVPGRRFLVIGHYFRYADGDQFLLDVDAEPAAVSVYLHEGPAVETYAPSVSLALWRLIHERF